MSITINIEVRGENDEVLCEMEREVTYTIEKDEEGFHVVMIHPATDLGIEAVNKAEDHMNSNPELWATETDPEDMSGASDIIGQADDR